MSSGGLNKQRKEGVLTAPVTVIKLWGQQLNKV